MYFKEITEAEYEAITLVRGRTNKVVVYLQKPGEDDDDAHRFPIWLERIAATRDHPDVLRFAADFIERRNGQNTIGSLTGLWKRINLEVQHTDSPQPILSAIQRTTGLKIARAANTDVYAELAFADGWEFQRGLHWDADNRGSDWDVGHRITEGEAGE